MRSDEGVSQKKCPCFSVVKNLGSVVLLVDLNLTIPSADGSVRHIYVSNFTSTAFTKLFCFNESIPSGLTADIINGNEDFVEEWMDKVEAGCDAVSTCNGWSALGWARIGQIADQASTTSAANPRNAQPNMIDSSDIRFHLTSLRMNTKDGVPMDLSAYQAHLELVTADTDVAVSVASMFLL